MITFAVFTQHSVRNSISNLLIRELEYHYCVIVIYLLLVYT